jgi:hypothetical protein
MESSERVGILEAARELGVTPTTIRKRLDRLGAPVQLDPLDRRFRRISRDLLPALTAPGDKSRRASRSTPEAVGDAS